MLLAYDGQETSCLTVSGRGLVALCARTVSGCA